MTKIVSSLKALVRDERGATAIEYGLIAGLMAVVVIAAIGFLGGPIQAMFQAIATTVTGATPGGGTGGGTTP